MKKTKLTRSLLAACSIVALSVVLSGCLHSSDDPAPEPPTTTPDPEPEPETIMLPDDIPAGDDFALTAGEMTIAAGASTANGGVSFSCAAGGEDCVVTVAADGSATSTGGSVTAMLTAAAMAENERIQNEMNAEMTGRAMGVSTALVTGTTTAPTGWAAPMVSRGVSGMAMFSATGYEGGAGMSASDGWASGELTMSTRTHDNMLMVYSNIEAAMREPFGDVYGATAADNPGGLTYSDHDSAPATPNRVTIPATMSATVGAMLDSSRFPQAGPGGSGSMTYHYSGDKTDPGYQFDATMADGVSGMFNGALGTYYCDSSSNRCSVTVTDQNADAANRYTLSGAWTFQPNSGSTVVVQDSDYLTFGHWVSAPMEANSAGDYAGYDVHVFASGSEAFPQTSVDALAGKVTYEGPAAGVYATRDFEDGDVASAMHGSFMADVTLTADFDMQPSTTPGTDEAGTSLSGMITNFRGGDGMDDWEVTLERAAITSGAAAFAGTASGEMGTANSTGGAWSASLHGDGMNGAAPSGISGTFNANFTAAEIAGAFGAERQ